MNLKAPLEMTLQDHVAAGSTPPRHLVDNPGKKLVELMSDEDLLRHVESEVQEMRVERKNIDTAEGISLKIYRRFCAKYLFPNLRYLESIGRLPGGYDPAAIEKELKV